jgi:hypothetical protein
MNAFHSQIGVSHSEPSWNALTPQLGKHGRENDRTVFSRPDADAPASPSLSHCSPRSPPRLLSFPHRRPHPFPPFHQHATFNSNDDGDDGAVLPRRPHFCQPPRSPLLRPFDLSHLRPPARLQPVQRPSLSRRFLDGLLEAGHSSGEVVESDGSASEGVSGDAVGAQSVGSGDLD